MFWDEELRVNVDPFQEMEEGFFAATWDLKVRLLRAPSTLSHSERHFCRVF